MKVTHFSLLQITYPLLQLVKVAHSRLCFVEVTVIIEIVIECSSGHPMVIHAIFAENYQSDSVS
jgi:hypothetical protein